MLALHVCVQLPCSFTILFILKGHGIAQFKRGNFIIKATSVQERLYTNISQAFVFKISVGAFKSKLR
jgi:hypothetical protein